MQELILQCKYATIIIRNRNSDLRVTQKTLHGKLKKKGFNERLNKN